MAVSASLWFHYCAASGWFPAERTRFLLTTIENQGSRGRLQRENYTKQDILNGSAELLDRSCRQMMFPKLAVLANSWSQSRGRCKQLPGPTRSFRHELGQFMLPAAATRWSL